MADSAERVLSEAELRAALLARQGLLERRKSSTPKMLERMGTLQAQYAPSMYTGLWSRVADFDRGSLTRDLEKGRVVQGTLMRQTIHLVSKDDWWPIALAIREARREAWLRVPHHDADARRMRAVARKVRKLLADGPMSRAELQKAGDLANWELNGANCWVDLVRVPPSGTWERRRADLYGLAEELVGPEPSDITDAAARELLAKRYLTGFGPATPTEFADFAGIKVTAARAAFDRLELRVFRSEDDKPLYDLPRLPLPDPEEAEASEPRFLGTWDAVLLVHARRAQVLPEEHRSKIFSTKTPQSVPSFTVAGRVAGSWRYEKGRVTTKPFRRLTAAEKKAVRAEADRLLDFHA